MNSSAQATRPSREISLHWPAEARRLWSGPVDDSPRTVHFRRVFELPEKPGRAELLLWAEGRFHLWCNGRYVTRGPLLHHPDRRAVLPIDLKYFLRPGKNVLAVLAQSPGTSLQNFVWSREPGPVGTLRVQCGPTEFHVHTDASWRSRVAQEWLTNVPRRGWATAWIEACDATNAEIDWQSLDFNDRHWQAPDLLPPSAMTQVKWERADVPPIVAQDIALPAPVAIYRTTAAAPQLARANPSNAFGQALLDEPWEVWRDAHESVKHDASTNNLTLRNPHPDSGVVLVFDLGIEHTGQILFDLHATSPGIIDIAWSEVFHNDRPTMMLKGNTYADRLIARSGLQRWEPVNYSAFRYVALICREFHGPIALSNLRVRSTRMDVDYSRAAFTCSDARLNDIWNICVRTLAISAQEGLTDCPTREQAVYLADAPLVGRWIYSLTGDARPWRHTMREAFIRPGSNSLLKDAVYAPTLRTLADFNLVAVYLLRDYLQQTSDKPLLRDVLPNAINAVQWFLAQRDATGRVNIDWQQMRAREPAFEQVYLGAPLGEITPWLFIDHPGMGWHNVGQPGIDRQGQSSALHAWLALACDSIASMLEQLEQPTDARPWRESARELRRITAQTFFDAAHGSFADGLHHHEKKLSPQHSQQANTAALLAQCVGTSRDARETADQTQRVLNYVLSPDADSARNGPYYWAYLLEVLDRENRVPQALAAIRELWGAMLERGATTAWETFAGDHLDSWCHPWSAAPAAFLSCVVLGLRPPRHAGQRWVIQPRYDLLESARGSLPVPGTSQSIALSWQPRADHVQLHLRVPADVPYELHDLAGKLRVVTEPAS